MNSILAALLLPPSNGASASPASTSSAGTQTQTPSSTADPTSLAQFKAQVDQAVAALTNAAGSATHASTVTTASVPTTTTGSAAQSATVANALQATLQQKIADLLNKGETVSEIVQQLAASLASALAAQFGGNPAQIQNQLQTAFASALSPPTTGPPQTTADLASALAQRFRQVADVAAGVIGETGQSNRLFAGSISDAASTAGVQPAPPTSGNGPAPADSTATDASALFASLTASQGDGKTVALNGAPALGSNGDTLLGRILARAAQSSSATAASRSQNVVVDTTTPVALQTGPATTLTSLLAAAAAALGNGTPAPSTGPVTTLAATELPAAAVQNALADAETTSGNSGSTTSAAPEAAQLSPTVTAFLKVFTDALASTSTTQTASKTTTNGDSPTGTLLTTTVASSQAPTIGAFAPVQPALDTNAASSNGAQTPAQLPSQTTVDQSDVVDQLIRGAFLNSVGSTSTVRLKLVPDSLGDISVKLTVNGSSVDAQVMAQTPAAHDALVAGQGQLTRALADAGLKLNSFNVDLAGGFMNFQQQQQQSSGQGQSNGRTLLLGGVDTPESDESALVAAPNFGPPVLTGASWSALNYLV
jgi:flagellar hook-length control protein FliK